MDKLWWRAAWGLCLVQLSLAQLQIDLNITCRYAGVFHVEKNGRYSISRTEAPDLCKAFNSTLPTMAQMQQALAMGFETCRYGFIQGHVVIPRIHPNAICAANNTGVYILTSNTSHYDTYCFNASAPLDEEDCTSVTDLPNSFDGKVTITIVNRDGTRYSKKGAEYRTHEEDINPSQPIDEDMSSGSSSERSTSGGYTIFHTHLPTSQPSTDQEDAGASENNPTTITSTVHSNSRASAQKRSNWIWSWFGNSQPKTQDLTTTAATGMDSNAISTGWEPNEENEDERDKHVSFSGSGIDDDEDFVSSTISTTPRVSDHTEQNQDWNQWRPSHSNPEAPLETTTRITDVDRNGPSAHGENRTQEPQPPLIHHEPQDEEEAPHSTSTTWETSSSTTEETATQREQWFGNGWHGGYHQTPRGESHSTAGTTEASVHDGHPDQRMTTQRQEDYFWTDYFDPISHPMGRGHQTERTMDVDSSHSTTLQPPVDPNTDSVEDVNGTGPISVTTQHSHSQSFSTSHGELEEDKEQTTVSTITSGNRNDGRGGRRGGNPPEDSTTSLEGKTSHYPDTRENRTLMPVTPAQPGVFGVTEVPVGDFTSNVDGSLPGDQDAGGRSHTTHGSGSAGHSSGSQEGGATTTSGPIRKPHIPEWLIILASLLALALILAVCIAVNSRRRCGQKKKLVINNGNGTVDDRKPSGLNGEASKSQEMVHLVNKESSETPDQFMTADETRNLQNVDMKIGV
ncbi:CD44 molecule (Indian blood group), transcript variant X5 [Ictidomys tridecemlineatus]|uniref:CD44 antigen isoform X5 n=1 Tax=Ictidomys tridecemlineatus TaxID=43179 RepID=UPI000B545C45|nr:CD44 antigen isoform X5 [Ictidomys tridecemlineatus]KAG3285474.1 CD44 molecule (Indian blood group), transcript variant X5 [Ictidomys tridecemlineatus]